MATKQLTGSEVIDLKQIMNNQDCTFGPLEGDIYVASTSAQETGEIDSWTIRELGSEPVATVTAQSGVELTMLTTDAAKLRLRDVLSCYDGGSAFIGAIFVVSIGADVAGDTIVTVGYAGNGLRDTNGDDVSEFALSGIVTMIAPADDIIGDGQVVDVSSKRFPYVLVSGTCKLVITPLGYGILGKK